MQSPTVRACVECLRTTSKGADVKTRGGRTGASHGREGRVRKGLGDVGFHSEKPGVEPLAALMSGLEPQRGGA